MLKQYFSNKYPVEVKKINDEIFFRLKDICNILGFKNYRDALSKYCDPKGVAFYDTLTQGGNQRARFINEPNVYALIYASKNEDAKQFMQWVYKDVLPAARKQRQEKASKENPKKSNNTFTAHVEEDKQRQNSRVINAIVYKQGGVEAVKQYNRDNCLLHTGLLPSELKERAKLKGYKSSECKSAKEILRREAPDIACAMSFTDQLVKQGKSLDEVRETSRAAVKVFAGMLKMGLKPPELEQ